MIFPFGALPRSRRLEERSRGGVGMQEAAGHYPGWDSPQLELWLNLSASRRSEEEGREWRFWSPSSLGRCLLCHHHPPVTEIPSGFRGEIFSFSLLLRDAYVQLHLFACLFFWLAAFYYYWCFCFSYLSSCESLYSQTRRKETFLAGRYLRMLLKTVLWLVQLRHQNIFLMLNYILHTYTHIIIASLDWILYPSTFLECNCKRHVNDILLRCT